MMKDTFVIILDEDVVPFLDEKANGDPSAYLNQLLEQEKRRQAQQSPRGSEGEPQKLQELLDSTPNASA